VVKCCSVQIKVKKSLQSQGIESEIMPNQAWFFFLLVVMKCCSVRVKKLADQGIEPDFCHSLNTSKRSKLSLKKSKKTLLGQDIELSTS
jgi:hypothetical protein